MKNLIKQSLMTCVVLVILCGLIYPLAITGLSNLFFHKQANGSIISYNNKETGSELLGQSFSGAEFFHGRVSSINYNTYTKEDATPAKAGKKSYTGVTSGSSNLAPSNELLTARIDKDVTEFLHENQTINRSEIPEDLITNSGSGLDPEISIQAAIIQIPRISKSTKISTEELNRIVEMNTLKRALGVFGEERVNFLKCNLEIARRLDIK
jgi:potassium-transporting ATPase KdpC subunit